MLCLSLPESRCCSGWLFDDGREVIGRGRMFEFSRSSGGDREAFGHFGVVLVALFRRVVACRAACSAAAAAPLAAAATTCGIRARGPLSSAADAVGPVVFASARARTASAVAWSAAATASKSQASGAAACSAVAEPATARRPSSFLVRSLEEVEC
ncbi:hypothetical protein SEVIR_5G403850v4 [Setaria viridis]